MKFDVVIIGSGFGGAVCAHVLDSLGYSVCVLDKESHPRFAIGESSTPLADRSLSRLSEKYGIPWLDKLSSYGKAKSVDSITVGPKRGFSYFFQEKHQDFSFDIERNNELLIAASSGYEKSDTNWLRSTVDAFVVKQFSKTRVVLKECFEISSISQSDDCWVILGVEEKVTADFLINASGRDRLVTEALGLTDETFRLKTNSRAIYSHFEGVQPWTETYRDLGGDDSIHPFNCSHAALHQVLNEGWMWQLNFDTDVMSCGFVLDRETTDKDIDWHSLLEKYPTVKRQFEDSCLAESPGRIIETDRLQFLQNKGAGEGWLSLPSSIGFVDPLHSTGIAHTLNAIEKIGVLFSKGLPDGVGLSNYSDRVIKEIKFIDELVSIAYATRRNAESFVIAVMLYFIATIHAERSTADFGFLGVENRLIHTAVIENCGILRDGSLADLEQKARVSERLRTLDPVGLFDADKSNMHAHTAFEGKK